MDAKAERIEVRVSPEQKALLDDAAARSGLSLSAFVASAALARARRRDGQRFLEIMDRDEEPTPALKAAARKYRRDR